MKLTKTWRRAATAAGCSLALGSTVLAEDATTTRPSGTDSSIRADHDTEAHASQYKNIVVRQLSDLSSGDVYGNDGKQIGHIESLAVDAAAGRIVYAVVEFDRMADLVDKHFAVPWAAIDKKIDEKNTSKVVYAMNADHDRLKNAKGIENDRWPDVAQLRQEDTQALWNVPSYWPDSARTRVTVRSNDKDVDVKVDADKDHARLQGTPVSNDTDLLVRANAINGHKIIDEQGHDVAELHNIMVDTKSGRFVYGIVQVNKTPDLKTDFLNPVPWQTLQVTPTGKDQDMKAGVLTDKDAMKVTLKTSLDKVNSGPKFPEREWPNMTPQWGEQVYSAYGVRPFWTHDRANRSE